MTVWIHREQGYKVASVAWGAPDGRAAISEEEGDPEDALRVARLDDEGEGWVYYRIAKDGQITKEEQ